jgi:hypothetical protein
LFLLKGLSGRAPILPAFGASQHKYEPVLVFADLIGENRIIGMILQYRDKPAETNGIFEDALFQSHVIPASSLHIMPMRYM